MTLVLKFIVTWRGSVPPQTLLLVAAVGSIAVQATAADDITKNDGSSQITVWVGTVMNLLYSEWCLACFLPVALEAARLNNASARMVEMLSEGCHGDPMERAAFRTDITGAPVTFAVAGGALRIDYDLVRYVVATVGLALATFLGNVIQNTVT